MAQIFNAKTARVFAKRAKIVACFRVLLRKQAANAEEYCYPYKALYQEKQESDDPDPFDPYPELLHYRAITSYVLKVLCIGGSFPSARAFFMSSKPRR